MNRFSSCSVSRNSEVGNFGCLRRSRCLPNRAVSHDSYSCLRAAAVGLSGLDAERLDTLLGALDALPVVKPPAKLDPKFSGGTGRVIVNLWCGGTHKGAMKQPCVPLNKKPPGDPAAVSNYFVAAEKLIEKIKIEHAGCLVAAESAKVNAGQPAGASSHGALAKDPSPQPLQSLAEPDSPTSHYFPSLLGVGGSTSAGSLSLSAFFVMRKLQPLRQRVEAKRKAEFSAAAATKAAEREMISEEQNCGLKVRRVEPDETDDDYHEWARLDWLRLETWTRNRPASPPDVSPCKGIQSHYSFLFLGTPGHYAMRKWSCWCPACSRMRGRGYGAISQGSYLVVPDCQRKKLTIWEEDKFTVKAASGIKERQKRLAER